MKKHGLLLTLTEPPPAMLATYELDGADVLASPKYLSFFEKPTPWTRRCLGKALVFKRWACEQIEPGDAELAESALQKHSGLAYRLYKP